MSKKRVSLTPVVSDQIVLDEYDPSGGEVWVQFQQPTGGDEEAIDALTLGDLVWDNDNRQRIVNRAPISRALSMQVAHTLVGSNLEDESGNLIFVPGKTCRQPGESLNADVRARFLGLWNRMPRDFRNDTIRKLHGYYPPFVERV